MTEKGFLCGACVRTLTDKDEHRLIEKVKEHAKKDHNMELSDEDVKKGIKEVNIPSKTTKETTIRERVLSTFGNE